MYELQILLKMFRLPASLLHEITKVIQHAKGVSATKPVSTEARLQVEDGEVVVSCEAS